MLIERPSDGTWIVSSSGDTYFDFTKPLSAVSICITIALETNGEKNKGSIRSKAFKLQIQGSALYLCHPPLIYRLASHG